MINIFHGTTTLGLRKFLLSDVGLTGAKFSTLFGGGESFQDFIFLAALAIKKVGTATHETRNFMTLVKANLRRRAFLLLFPVEESFVNGNIFNFECRRRRSVA